MADWRPPQHIRVRASALILHRDHILFAEGFDSSTGESFWYPPGGEIRFGERAEDAVVREIREELGRSIEITGRLGASENLFTLGGVAGHEVVFEFVARFVEADAPDNLDPLETVGNDAETFVARWFPLAEVLAGTHHFVPEGLPERLAAWVNTL